MTKSSLASRVSPIADSKPARNSSASSRPHQLSVAYGGILEPTVQISPIGAARRQSAGWQGLTTENIYAPAERRIECQYCALSHLLVMYVDGIRRDGETFIDGLTPSTLRNVTNKLTFVPANHAYNEWHEARTPMRISYLYLDPARFNRLGD